MLLYSCILVLSIALTNAARLDGSCTENAQCEGVSLWCQDGFCRCRTPLYRPCNASCVIKPRSAYEGEPCEVEHHCVENSACSSEKKCQCLTGFPARNGLCFKDFNDTCTNNSECWSQYCSNGRCVCAPDFEPFGSHTSCRRKLVKIYTSWAEASSNNQFCFSSASCIDSIAECVADQQHPTERFCKCPYGFRVTDNNERCEPNGISLLSPLDIMLANYSECGACEDSNAACMTAASEKTCWCRSGYGKKGNACERNVKAVVVFPNPEDLALHDFVNDCANKSIEQYEEKDQLCVCAAGYEYVPGDRTCVKIQRRWINDVQEYGVCTRIDSRDMANGDNGLCPEPLKCEERRDKHVCSCGTDRFLDVDNPTQCVYYIGRRTNASDDQCPKNAVRNSTTGICVCLGGHKVANGNRQCELKLSAEVDPARANASQPYDEVCTRLFGKRVFLSAAGECRCSGVQSFPDNARTHCYAPINQRLVAPMEDCPENAVLDVDHCKCNAGYRPSSNASQCVRMQARLDRYTGPTITDSNDLTESDCKVLFSGPVQSYTNDICQCKEESFVNDAGNGCWYRFGVTVPAPTELIHCPPDTSTESGLVCVCDAGFINDGIRCVPSTTQLNVDRDPATPNVPNLNDAICVKWFGTGAIKAAEGDYCRCNSNAYPVSNDTYCHFFIDAESGDIKGTRTCPANTKVSESSPTSRACVCQLGFRKSVDNRTCEAVPLLLIGAIDRPVSPPTSCLNFTNEDCIAKFGEGAFCQSEQCYCDRRSSYVNTQRKCESFSQYIFPGAHERNFYSCNTDEDCGSKMNVICGFLSNTTDYKVCHCKGESLLDPKTQTCGENRCTANCDASQNFECRGYECVCKEGYYLEGSRCVQQSSILELYQPCNGSAVSIQSSVATVNNTLECDGTCGRAQCRAGYRPDRSQCVRYELDNDRCLYRESECPYIDENAICNRDGNQCTCRPSYYKFDDKCVRAVGSACTKDEQCGPVMMCKGQRCSCNEKQHVQNIVDIYGRPLQRCVNDGGQMQFSALVLLLALVERLFL